MIFGFIIIIGIYTPKFISFLIDHYFLYISHWPIDWIRGTGIRSTEYYSRAKQHIIRRCHETYWSIIMHNHKLSIFYGSCNVITLYLSSVCKHFFLWQNSCIRKCTIRINRQQRLSFNTETVRKCTNKILVGVRKHIIKGAITSKFTCRYSCIWNVKIAILEVFTHTDKLHLIFNPGWPIRCRDPVPAILFLCTLTTSVTWGVTIFIHMPQSR